MNAAESILKQLAQSTGTIKFNRGIERETLRLTPDGKLAQTPHPDFLGSKLTHPCITTDFSESQLELITPVNQSVEAAINYLRSVHQFVYSGLGDELLWSASMPCVIPGDEKIPLANYGTSNLATLKTTYRSGLGYRYGRSMQTICAVHYNFSFSNAFWDQLQQLEQANEPAMAYRSRRYFDLMRNFRRYSWLLLYLFGASPAVCRSFVDGKDHNLQAFDDNTYHLPHATSLRSGNLGYQSDTQAGLLKVCYNQLQTYIETLRDGILTPHPTYEAIGLKDGDTYKQVNTNILQSEAEFYTTIRAKRVPSKGENFLSALKERGVEYLEVRLLDVNPYLPLGIDEDQVRFLDTFLVYCLLTPSPEHDDLLCDEVQANLIKTVYEGRDTGLQLSDHGKPRSASAWANQLLDDVSVIGRQLDDLEGTSVLGEAIKQQRARVNDTNLTPSGRVLNDMRSKEVPFVTLAMDLARSHRELLSEPLDDEKLKWFREASESSRQAQKEIEQADSASFDEYLAEMLAAYKTV